MINSRYFSFEQYFGGTLQLHLTKSLHDKIA